MFSEIDTKNAGAVRDEVIRLYRDSFSGAPPNFITEMFQWTEDCFSGRYGDFQAIDAKYHDLEHTLQVTLCFARLLHGYHAAHAKPTLTPRAFELGLLAILLHDTGYLKKKSDTEGTGAKYTLTHVARSAEFASKLLKEKRLHPDEIVSVQNMIRCTGVNADLKSIPFQSELERRVGCALATADLLGQMAAHDYIDKLGILFQEFEESNRYNGKASGTGLFSSADDLRQKTPQFWAKYVLPKIQTDFEGLYHFLDEPAPGGRNEYLVKIEQNMKRLQGQLNTTASSASH
jgi:hypothetical protein